ncbi:O-antigen ligase family protein [Haloferula sp. BvORR071]|uniref:O-antigen ligase family protein n=1 Tax=Haloferula sp. BvORR071 TaxID=1396141 RepID=UPI0005594949|nr:O-antigen ligase family protein [Haloferula sp. BvORR071]
MRNFPPSVRWFPGQSSAIAFAVALALAMVAIAFPEMPAQLLLGLSCAGAGLLFLFFPPVARLPLVWWILGLGFLGLSLAGFMPRGWAGMPGWRQDLESLGLDTGPLAIVQVPLAAEALGGIAVVALLALFLLGHRVDSRMQRGLALAFVIFCALWVVVALVAYHPGGEEVFGFFPNRNHTATLLAMAVLVAWGCLMHAITHKHMIEVAVSAVALLLFLYVILCVSVSRAGVLLVAVGIFSWLPLAGMRYLRGDLGKAVLLLIFGLVVGLVGIDTPVKQRLTASFATDGTPGVVVKDARIGIQRDALGMISAEPWCGVGPGQFPWIFPQYRKLTPVSSEMPCLHPESDWLMIAAEHGWPAALCLAAGVAAVFFAGFRAARQGHSRALRMACMVAAMLLGLHGLLDIPGHREGLALAAVLLLALSLRPLEHGTTRGAAPPSRFAKIGWRAAGLAMAALGALLLHAQWSERPLLPSAIAKAERQWAEKLREMDRVASAAAREAGTPYRPAKEEDPLRLARTRIDRATMIEPLDPSLQFARGVIALHFNGGEDSARQAFAIQRRLEPQQSLLLLKQAATWGKRDPVHVKELWELALQHAAVEEQRLPETQHAVKNIYEGLFSDAAANPDLAPLAFEFSGHDFARLEKWIRFTPPAAIDRYFPQLPADKLSGDERGMLLTEWSRRGSPQAVEDFKREHPDFAPPSPGASEGK